MPPAPEEDPPERPRGEDPPSKGQEPPGQASSPGTDEGQAPPSHLRLRLGWTPRPVPGSQSRPSSCCTLGRMMRGPWMPTSMPTTRPSRSTFGRWISGKGGDLGQDMLGEEPYSTMCSMAMAGKVALVGGGPNCRTWSILRWFPKPGGPPPVRGRAEQTLWGLEDLEPRVMEDTDNDSVLMLRQMYLTLLAYKGLGQLTVPQVGSSFLEHPMDPMECSKSPSAARCSSIWVTRAYVQWARALHHSLIKFDECRRGCEVHGIVNGPSSPPLA